MSSTTTEGRLLQCFRAIFPAETEQTLSEATPDLLERWDSNNHFLLVELVEEEFAIQIPDSVGGELLSFRDFENYVKANAPS